MTQMDRFVAAFNQLHHTMAKLLKAETKDIPFANAIIQLYSERNPVITQHKSEIEVIRQLRNLLIHEDIYPNHDIAEPSEHIIELTLMIERKLALPKTIAAFQRSVISFQTTDYLTVILKTIRKHGYSQFPIFNEKGFVGILSDNGITRWLASHQSRTISLNDIMVADVMSAVDDEKNKVYRFIANSETLFKAHAIFTEGHSSILLMTEDGLPPQKAADIQGIITAWDFPDVVAQLS
ncbi:CBS domain-containing protein [Aerococcaceae bacterium NML180378]|nr:CBS domain-containing protein [Aerococcaceae bacterium NML180378]